MSNEEKPVQAPANVRRRLAAILAADVKGYSRLMGEDEVATLRTLTASREVTDALIAQHHGRIVGTAGDSILAEQTVKNIAEAVRVWRVQLEEADSSKFKGRNPNFLTAHTQLAAAYSESGREEEAQAQVAEVLKLNPHFSLEMLEQRIPYKDPAEVERYVAALRKAGLK